MDDFGKEFARTDEFEDVVTLVILKKNKDKHLKKLVADRRLPLLLDTEEVDFERIYGFTSGKPWRVFDRRGCIAADSLGLRLKDAEDPALLMQLLREIDH